MERDLDGEGFSLVAFKMIHSIYPGKTGELHVEPKKFFSLAWLTESFLFWFLKVLLLVVRRANL